MSSAAEWRSRAVAIVWNRDSRRLRAPVRVTLALVAFVVVSLAGAAAVGRLTGGDPLVPLPAEATEAGLGVGSTVVSTVLTVGAVALAGATLDRRRLADFGFHVDRGWWLDCGFGALLGLGLQAAVLAVGAALGWFRVVGLGHAAAGFSVAGLAGAYLVTFVGVSLGEELFVRGYLLTNLAEGLTGLGPISGRGATALATLATAALFGLLHLPNPNATLLSTASIALAGVFLAAGYLLTGELSVPLGLHFGWNYAQGVVFGFPVSGLGLGVGLVRTRETGPDLLTGGAFGPEGGLLGVGAILLGTALVAWWARAQTGTLALDPAVWTPDLRWRGGRATAPDADEAAQQEVGK